jgi:hypothetical protein
MFRIEQALLKAGQPVKYHIVEETIIAKEIPSMDIALRLCRILNQAPVKTPDESFCEQAAVNQKLDDASRQPLTDAWERVKAEAERYKKQQAALDATDPKRSSEPLPGSPRETWFETGCNCLYHRRIRAKKGKI